MKLIFAGTPPFAAAALEALHTAGHEIALVLTQPDRPAGRGMKLMQSAVAQAAARLGVPIEKPPTLKDADTQHRLRQIGADLMVVAAYGLILPQAVLDIPRLGCLNIHGSLLPRWRGAAPIQRAIEAGDAETGIVIMQMEAGLDTGPALLTRTLPITPDDTSASLFAKLTELGAAAIVEALEKLPQLIAVPQSAFGVTYAKKIDKTEAPIDWSQPATEIERRIRAFDPFPGCETMLQGATLKIWRASVIKMSSVDSPGRVISMATDHIIVQCGQDALALQVVQKPGGKRLSMVDFLHGTTVVLGEQLQ
ncbi:MAG: methionyl-tRNA formyltransferase [Betaproteobacteria bacterium]|nr:methionyl-tRNA formyltransferase [Betaproteobacteria bacterium]